MEINGRLIQILPAQSGTGKNGPWKKCDFVIETSEKFPKKLCLSAWNELSDQVEALKTGSELKVSFDLSSREYNARWYTDVKAWKIATANSDQSSGAEANSTDMPPDFLDSSADDEVPF